MHVINNLNKQRQTLIRFMFYGVIGLVVAVGTFILVLTLQGYGFDRSSGEVIRNGLVLIESEPVAAQIFINGQTEGRSTPQRMALPEDRYEFLLWRRGYRDWSRTLDVEGSQLHWLAYPLLIPKEIETEALVGVDDLSSFTGSANHEFMYAMLSKPEPRLVVFDAEAADIIPQSYALPQRLFQSSEKSVKKVRITSVSAGDQTLLLRHERGKTDDFLLFDHTDNSQNGAVNVSRLFDQPFTNMWFGENSNQLYATLGGNLHELDLSQEVLSAPLLSGVKTVARSPDNLLFAVIKEEDRQVVYRIQGRQTERLLVSRQKIKDLAAHTYDNELYLALLRGDGKTAVYRNPRNLPQQVPLKVLPYDGATDVLFSPDGRFVAALMDKKIRVFDLELQETHNFASENPQRSHWLDEFRLAVYDAKGNLNVIDYDGSNLQKIVAADSGYQAVMSNNSKYIFSVNDASSSAQLVVRRSLLVVPE